jgi:hypothetical protein
MKTLTTKAIIYDNTCPMCTWYTGQFVKTGALLPNNRLTFQNLDSKVIAHLDLTRARHEIPLYDTETGQVMYGLEGLTHIISNILPFTKGFVTRPTFRRMLQPLYNFISYNRRVIVPCKDVACGFSCAPDFSAKWRLALIAFGLGLTTLFAQASFSLLHIVNAAGVFAALGVFFLMQTALGFILNSNKQQAFNYAGNLAVLGIIESALLIPCSAIAAATGNLALFFIGFGVVKMISVTSHFKRVEYNNYGTWLNISYMVFTLTMALIVGLTIK